MSTEDNLKVIQSYMENHDPQFVAQDATYYDYTLAEPLHGREAIARMLDMLYRTAFPGARAEIQHLFADKDSVVAEYLFRGVNTGNLMGVPATSKPVEIPMCAVFEVANGAIQQIRMYYDSSLLTRQLGITPATA